MAVKIPDSPRRSSHSFQKVVDSFLGGEELPCASIRSAGFNQRVFGQHGWFIAKSGRRFWYIV